ncbi:hypothetical protein C8Q77DRAFT_738704 [Trametes polyzona]|nr:hypothetical protein C8Q77DRAFT_738704 [Trametes polyzona]
MRMAAGNVKQSFAGGTMKLGECVSFTCVYPTPEPALYHLERPGTITPDGTAVSQRPLPSPFDGVACSRSARDASAAGVVELKGSSCRRVGADGHEALEHTRANELRSREVAKRPRSTGSPTRPRSVSRRDTLDANGSDGARQARRAAGYDTTPVDRRGRPFDLRFGHNDFSFTTSYFFTPRMRLVFLHRLDPHNPCTILAENPGTEQAEDTELGTVGCVVGDATSRCRTGHDERKSIGGTSNGHDLAPSNSPSDMSDGCEVKNTRRTPAKEGPSREHGGGARDYSCISGDVQPNEWTGFLSPPHPQFSVAPSDVDLSSLISYNLADSAIRCTTRCARSPLSLGCGDPPTNLIAYLVSSYKKPRSLTLLEPSSRPRLHAPGITFPNPLPHRVCNVHLAPGADHNAAVRRGVQYVRRRGVSGPKRGRDDQARDDCVLSVGATA